MERTITVLVHRFGGKSPIVAVGGGGMTNTGRSIDVSDQHGNPRKPVLVYTRGQRACADHALVPVTVGDVLCTVFRHRDELTISLVRFKGFEWRLGSDDGLPHAEASVEAVASFCDGIWETELPERFKALVDAGIEKSRIYHCKTTSFLSDTASFPAPPPGWPSLMYQKEMIAAWNVSKEQKEKKVAEEIEEKKRALQRWRDDNRHHLENVIFKLQHFHIDYTYEGDRIYTPIGYVMYWSPEVMKRLYDELKVVSERHDQVVFHRLAIENLPEMKELENGGYEVIVRFDSIKVTNEQKKFERIWMISDSDPVRTIMDIVKYVRWQDQESKLDEEGRLMGLPSRLMRDKSNGENVVVIMPNGQERARDMRVREIVGPLETNGWNQIRPNELVLGHSSTGDRFWIIVRPKTLTKAQVGKSVDMQNDIFVTNGKSGKGWGLDLESHIVHSSSKNPKKTFPVLPTKSNGSEFGNIGDLFVRLQSNKV